MAVEGIILGNAREETDVALKHKPHQAAENAFDTPRASSVSTPKSSVSASSVRSTPARNGLREKPTKYVSSMAKAREEKKRREAAVRENNSDKCTGSSSDMEASSIPSTESRTSLHSDELKKSGPEDKLGNLPKFGEWDKHSVNSGPCYTLLFQNAAQEKKVGGIIRVHGSKPSDEQHEDLYNNPVASVKDAGRKKKKFSLLFCCFRSSESS